MYVFIILQQADGAYSLRSPLILSVRGYQLFQRFDVTPPLPDAFSVTVADDWYGRAKRCSYSLADALAPPEPVGAGQMPFAVVNEESVGCFAVHVYQHLAEESDIEVVARIAIGVLGGEDVITANKRLHAIGPPLRYVPKHEPRRSANSQAANSPHPESTAVQPRRG